MKTVEELKEEAQEEMEQEQEERTKSKIKDMLYNLADAQKGIKHHEERLEKFQKQLTEFKG